MLDHVGRNALVPVLTISGIQFAALLGGCLLYTSDAADE